MPIETRDQALTELERSAAELASLFAAPPAALARPYAPGKWTARQVLAHVVDAQQVMYDRLCRLAADHEPLLWNFDENRWAAGLAYDHRDPAILGRLHGAGVAAIVDLVRSLPADIDRRTGVHSTGGTRSFLQQLAYLAGHGGHHAAQARAAIAGRTWTAAG